VRKSYSYGYFWTQKAQGPIHSKDNTVGLVLASATVGATLDESGAADNTRVVFSRDGGVEWWQLANGSYVYLLVFRVCVCVCVYVWWHSLMQAMA
jgi:hypothetical protein